MAKLTSVIWNFDDIESNLLAVDIVDEAIGYFRMDTDEFVIITEDLNGPRIHINVLRSIVNGYDDALKEAKSMVETTLS
jgi:hypothetical protein